MKVKNIVFSGFAAAILMGTVSANAAIPFQIASKAYVDGQTKMTVGNQEKDVTEVVADLIGDGEGSVDDKISDAIGTLGNDANDQPYSDVADALADKADKSEIGDLDDLTTTEDGSIVGAINELDSAIDGKQDKLGGENNAGVVVATTTPGSVTYTTIDTSIGAQGTNNLITSAAVKAYVDSAIDGVSGDAGSIATQIGEALGDLGSGNATVEDALADKQDTIDDNNMLDADLVDDTTSAHKFVTASDKQTWNAKQDALTPGSNIQIVNGTISATDTTYSTGTASVEGLTKLYTGVGDNTDGTMTQAAIKAALLAVLPAASTCTSENNHCVLSVNKTTGALEWVDVTSPFEIN